MFVVVTRLKFSTAHSERVQAIIHGELVPAMQRTPGFIEFLSAPSRSDTETVEMINVSLWKSEADFGEYFKIRNTIVPPHLLNELMPTPPERLAFSEVSFHAAGGQSDQP